MSFGLTRDFLVYHFINWVLACLLALRAVSCLTCLKSACCCYFCCFLLLLSFLFFLLEFSMQKFLILFYAETIDFIPPILQPVRVCFGYYSVSFLVSLAKNVFIFVDRYPISCTVHLQKSHAVVVDELRWDIKDLTVLGIISLTLKTMKKRRKQRQKSPMLQYKWTQKVL